MNNRKIPTLEELNELLKKSNYSLDTYTMRYINSLINLEFSALREDILTQEERKELNKLTIYRKAVIYNIYNRAMQILQKEKKEYDLNIINNNDNFEGILASCNIFDNKIRIYKYDYSDNIQQVLIHEYKEDFCKRDIEKERILQVLEYLYNARDNNINLLGKTNGVKANIDISKKIIDLEERYYRLATRTLMNEDDKNIAEIQNHFSKLFEKEYAINRKKDYKKTQKSKYDLEHRNDMFQVLEKEYPTLTLKKEVKYY